MSKDPTELKACVPFGVVGIDLFNIEIGLFDTNASRVGYLKAQDIEAPCESDTRAYRGLFTLDYGPGDVPYFCITLPDSDRDNFLIWIHEASHAVDAIFDELGIPADYSSTELRAYMLQHIVEQIEDAVFTLETSTSKLTDRVGTAVPYAEH